jgi:hypothetical protein
LIVTALFLWGALSDVRAGLSFVYAAGLASAVFLGSESLGTRDHNFLLKFETSVFVASYDSQDHGGGMRPRLHTVVSPVILADPRYIVSARTAHKISFPTATPLLGDSYPSGPHRKHRSSVACAIVVTLMIYLLCRNLVTSLTAIVMSQY